MCGFRPRLQRRDHAGFSPASLLSRYGAYLYQISAPGPAGQEYFPRGGSPGKPSPSSRRSWRAAMGKNPAPPRAGRITRPLRRRKPGSEPYRYGFAVEEVIPFGPRWGMLEGGDESPPSNHGAARRSPCTPSEAWPWTVARPRRGRGFHRCYFSDSEMV
jgi:hypothetical protein